MMANKMTIARMMMVLMRINFTAYGYHKMRF
jgi:hypothetical protein